MFNNDMPGEHTEVASVKNKINAPLSLHSSTQQVNIIDVDNIDQEDMQVGSKDKKSTVIFDKDKSLRNSVANPQVYGDKNSCDYQSQDNLKNGVDKQMHFSNENNSFKNSIHMADSNGFSDQYRVTVSKCTLDEPVKAFIIDKVREGFEENMTYLETVNYITQELKKTYNQEFFCVAGTSAKFSMYVEMTDIMVCSISNSDFIIFKV